MHKQPVTHPQEDDTTREMNATGQCMHIDQQMIVQMTIYKLLWSLALFHIYTSMGLGCVGRGGGEGSTHWHTLPYCGIYIYTHNTCRLQCRAVISQARPFMFHSTNHF